MKFALQLYKSQTLQNNVAISCPEVLHVISGLELVELKINFGELNCINVWKVKSVFSTVHVCAIRRK